MYMVNLTDSPTRLPVDLEYTNITDPHVSGLDSRVNIFQPIYTMSLTTAVERNLKPTEFSGCQLAMPLKV